MFATAILLIGCSAGSSGAKTHAIAPAVFDAIHPGMSANALIAALGEPAYKSTADAGTEMWRWTYREQQRPDGSTILLFNTRNPKGATGTAYVQLKDGIVIGKSRG